MENIWLFLLSVWVYSAVWGLIQTPPLPLKKLLKAVALIALLCLPLNIDGHVFTVIGNAKGEKGVYSLCSFYQESKGNVFTIVGVGGYQKAGRDAATLIGLAGYQKAGRNAELGIGLAGYQKAGGDAATFMGLSGYQKAGKDAVFGIGLAGYQEAGEDAATLIGLTGYQKADNSAVAISIACYQNVAGKTRAFAAFSKLKKE